jgi:hypothetical protein
MAIRNSAASELSGVLLANSGPGQIDFYFDRAVQGLGFMIESQHVGPVTYYLNCYAIDGSGYFLTVAVKSADGGPVYFGFVDPDARIGIVSLRSDAGNDFLVGEMTQQLPTTEFVDPAALPVVASESIVVSNTASYLHEGLNVRWETPATDSAAADNANVYDLSVMFPNLSAGDYIHFERLGYSLRANRTQNQLMGLFSTSETIKRGREFQRVDAALDAGTDFYTAQVKGDNFNTPSNISQDFIIGSSSFVSVPDGARYIMLSLQEPSADVSPLGLRMSHIQHDAFAEWIAARGMHGPNADPDADLDGDGLTLLEEFAFNKDPSVSDGEAADFAFQPKLSPLAAPGELSLVFGARMNAPVRYWAEYSSDLVTWDRLPDPINQPFFLDGAGGSGLFMTSDPDSGPTRFGRIAIEYISRP